MKKFLFSIGMVLLFGFAILGAKIAAAQPSPQQSPAPEWNPAAIKECDRACLVGIMDGYMDAIFKHDPKAVPPLALDVRMTENTGHMDVGEGMLWRSHVEPTTFKIYIADPVEGQVALQTRLKIEGRNALVAVRLKIDRGKILEIEQLWDRNINDAAIPLLTTPRETLVNDVPVSQRSSREVLFRAANSYFDALEGDDGGIAAFADDCVRHENGYQTVNNPPPGGRMMPAPMLPDPNTDAGQAAAQVQHDDVQTADRQQDVRVHEAHPAAQGAGYRRTKGTGGNVPVVRTRRDQARRCAGRASGNAAESGDHGDLRNSRRADPRSGGMPVRHDSLWAGQRLDGGFGTVATRPTNTCALAGSLRKAEIVRAQTSVSVPPELPSQSGDWRYQGLAFGEFVAVDDEFRVSARAQFV